MQKNKLLIYSFFCLLLLPVQIFAQSNAGASQRDVIEEQMNIAMSNLAEKHNQARKLYADAEAQAANLTLNVMAKLTDLDERISEAEGLEDVNKAGLTKAKTLRESAKSQIDLFQYETAENTIEEAIGSISTVPIITLQVEPPVFSPDGDGINDRLKLSNRINSRNGVSAYRFTIYQEVEKPDGVVLVSVKSKIGSNAPPQLLVWNGKLDDGTNVADSASTFYAELEATDTNGGAGLSAKVKFKTDIFVIKTDRGLMIDISSIIFDFGSDVLKDKYKPIVQALYRKLGEYPDYKIAVEGHTDSIGGAPANKKLSERRAASVLSYLTELGIAAERIKSYGLGEEVPKTTEAAKIDLNRRVNFFLLKTEEDQAKYDGFISALDFNKEVEMIGELPQAAPKAKPAKGKPKTKTGKKGR